MSVKKYSAILPVMGLILLALIVFSGCEHIEIDKGSGAGAVTGTQSGDNGETEPARVEYHLQARDILEIKARPDPEEGINDQYEVSESGTIKLLHIGKSDVSGLTATEVEDEIEDRYKNIYKAISITVKILRFYTVSGEVPRPGRYSLIRRTDLLEAINTAGGFSDFAKESRVTITRKNPDGTINQMVINCDKIRRGKKENVPIKADDFIYVPPGAF